MTRKIKSRNNEYLIELQSQDCLKCVVHQQLSVFIVNISVVPAAVMLKYE